MELLALGGAAAAIAGVARYVTGSGAPTPVYTLTPPAFDRLRPDSVLTSTPLEVFQHPRRKLYSYHYSDHLLDVRLHMAPRGLTNVENDFMAHIWVPRSQPGVPPRPLASARFHLQHPQDPNSFSNFVLKTEGGGAAHWNGAINLTDAIARAREPASPATPLLNGAGGVVQPVIAKRQVASAPQGVSAFFNVPLFRAGDGAAAQSPLDGKPFAYRPSLKHSPVLGLRLDQRATDGRSGYSVGLHCDPKSTLSNMQGGRKEQVQLGGWIAQETDQFRLVAESTIQPMKSALPTVVNSAQEGQPAHPVAAAVPPRLAASLPAVVNSKLGFFYTPARAGQLRPGYEVGFTLANDSKGRQELVASYFHHLVVRRNIKNPFEKAENRSITNYIDLGMEVVYRNDQPRVAVAARELTPPSLRFGASWQVNKNSMAKFRVADSSVSLLYALKSWWEPSASAAVSVNHNFHSNTTQLGLSVSIENIGEVLFSKPDPAYRRMISSQKENIANQVELDEDY